MNKISHKCIMKSRIVALALISIILISPSLSAVNGYTISFNVSNVNAVTYNQIVTPKLIQINLIDGVSSSFDVGSKNNKEKQLKINLFDGIYTLQDDNFKDKSNQFTPESYKSNVIPIKIKDGIGTDTNDYDNDEQIKIIKIKQDHDRKALWERIFPLDRIRNNENTPYKEIQNDHSLSYVQISEINSENEESEQFLVSNYDLQDEIDKFIGKTNYVGIQLGKHWAHLTDV